MHHSQLRRSFVVAKPIGQESYNPAALQALEYRGALIGTRKRDGHKVIVEVGQHQKIRIYRSGMSEVDHRLDYIREELRALRLREGTVLVGELVIERTIDGRTYDDLGSVGALLGSTFKKAQKLLAAGPLPQLFVFNVLHDEPHHDLQSWPYRSALAWIQKKFHNGNYVVPIDEVKGTLESMLQQVTDSGWEGLVLYDAQYCLTWCTQGREPRPRGCYKLKPMNEDDFFYFPSGRRFHPDGSLKDVQLLQWGRPDEDGASHIICCGRLGTFDAETRASIARYTSPVLQVRYTSRYPKTGKLREPAFMRFRDDKKPNACIAPQSWPEAQFS